MYLSIYEIQFVVFFDFLLTIANGNSSLNWHKNREEGVTLREIKKKPLALQNISSPLRINFSRDKPRFYDSQNCVLLIISRIHI